MLIAILIQAPIIQNTKPVDIPILNPYLFIIYVAGIFAGIYIIVCNKLVKSI